MTGIDGTGAPTDGVALAASGNSWTSISDRAKKKDFEPVNLEEVLAKVQRMRVTYWRYRWQDDSVTPLIGPVAQDLVGEFYPGMDDKCISTQQADGVHFAAIKALEERTRSLAAENAELRAELETLQAIVEGLAGE